MLAVHAAFFIDHAVFHTDPDQRETALNHVQTLAEESRSEDGVVDYRLATDADDGTLFRFFEQHDDEAAFEAHADSEHFAQFAAVLPELLAGVPEVTRFEVDSATAVGL